MSIKDWPGGVVTDIPVEPSGNFEDSAASGVWTLDQVANYVKQDLWPTPGNIDLSKYVEGVFSTYLYTGNGTSQTITNGIDLDGEGGLVWIKSRPDTYGHRLIDTERGVLKVLESYDTTAEATQAGSLTAFNSNGFSVGNAGHTNFSGNSFASWTFRKKEKFFDVVTYTGDGSVQSIAHNLGSVPKCMIVKKTSSTGDWYVYHIDLGAGINGRKTLKLNETGAQSDSGGFSDHPTDTEFSVNYAANTSGATYVAYLFASDAGGFGDDGTENIIKCGSYTGNGSSSGPTIDLGFEPQFVMIKAATNYTSGNWLMLDTMRGWTANSGNQTGLYANLSDAEIAANSGLSPTATGFQIKDTTPQINGSGNTYIYIAIRRPMKTPESGTEVFAPSQAGGTGVDPQYPTSFPVDMAIRLYTPGLASMPRLASRLTGAKYLKTSSSDAEVSDGNSTWDYMDGWFGSDTTAADNYGLMFKRATGFFDVVAYTGTGVAKTEAHNLGVVPEFFIVKRRDTTGSWYCYTQEYGATHTVRLNADSEASTSSSMFNDTNPTSSVFTVGTNQNSNGSGNTFIAYLFATLAGVSKVGSYTGTGSNVNVDCGFSAGARFILIKRTDSTGGWYVYDSARGIVAGNDPYLLLNSTAAQVTNTDYIDPLSSGFTVTSSAPAALNASGGTYIFLAIA